MLVEKLFDADSQLALAAYRVLAETQDDWSTRWPDSADSLHYKLVQTIESNWTEIPRERKAWIEQLVGQVLMDTLSSQSGKGQSAYAAAVRVLAKCAEGSRDPNAIDTNNFRIADRNLLGTKRQSTSEGTETTADQSTDESFQESQPNRAAPSLSVPPAPPELMPPGKSVRIAPPIPSLESAIAKTSSTVSANAQVQNVQQPFMVDSWEPYATGELIDLLHGSTVELQTSVQVELRRRGFNDAALVAAAQLAGYDTQQRLQFIQSLARRSDIDPRVFLVCLCQDDQRTVRMAAINMLGTMNDPSVRRELQGMLSTEADPLIAKQLRVALGDR